MGNTSQPGVIFRTPCRHCRPVRAVSGDHHRHQGVHTAPIGQGRRMCLARQACHTVHLAANVDSAYAVTGDPLTSMHTATATSTAGQGPRATPLSTKLGGTAPAGSLPSSSCWRMSRAGAAHTSTEAPARDTQAIMASFRQCNSRADGGEHFSGGQRTADRFKSGPAWWAGCRWFYH